MFEKIRRVVAVNSLASYEFVGKKEHFVLVSSITLKIMCIKNVMYIIR